MRTQFLFTGIVFLIVTASAFMQTTTINFDKDKVGESPKGFTTALTGRGKPGVWVVMKDDTAPSKGAVLAQTDADATGYRFPVCVYDGLSVKNADVSVKIKAVSGRGDQGGGIVWRYKDNVQSFRERTGAGHCKRDRTDAGDYFRL